MSVRRKQFSSHPRVDGDRSASANDIPQQHYDVTALSGTPGRSSSWSAIPPLYRSASSSHDVRRPMTKRKKSPAVLAQVDLQTRALRRQCLTGLIQQRFDCWRRFLDARKEAERVRVVALQMQCVHMIRRHSPHCIASLYFHKMMRWSVHQGDRRHQHRSLLAIRRSALKRLVFQYFSTWCRLCTVAQQQRIAATLLRRTLLVRARTAWDRWLALRAARHRFAATIQPALAQLQIKSVKLYMLSVMQRWRNVTIRRALVRRLAAVNASRQLSLWFHYWMRRRYWRQQVQETQRCMRRNLRLQAKGRLRLWMRWTVSKSVSNLLEQKNLSVIAVSYLAKWRRLCLCTAQVAHLRARVCEWRMRRYFAIWTSWMRRGIRAVLLEQRHLVCLLQRYHIEWRVHVEAKRLSYQSMRSYSHALQRHSYNTNNAAEEGGQIISRTDPWKGESIF
jgi:hypothetical protein